GKAADKFGRKKFVPLSILLVSIGFFTMPFAGIFVNKILFIFSLPFVLVGVLSLLIPLNAWSQDLLPNEKRGKFTGIFNIVNTLSQIVGSFAGRIIATIFGISWIFVLGPVFFMASIPLFLKVKETVKIK
ncbi:MAG: MFS transporter, partial [Candidatus Lokiarchaeota archaeon]|nr:MFS transporter [Candidatus Lokiarchaeota archaeon]